MRERSSVGFEIGVRTAADSEPVAEPKPFRIAILGDFSGRANRGLTGGAKSARPLLVDRDTFDQVMKQCKASLDLPIAPDSGSERVAFESLDDFHPDALCRRLPAFARLQDLRCVVNRPTPPAAIAGSAPFPKLDPAALAAGGLLDRIVDASETSAAPQRSARPDDLQAFLNRVTAGHSAHGQDAHQRQRQAQAESEIAQQLRSLLHHPEFQGLEAAWRSIFLLVRRLETGVDLQLSLLDISKQDLQEDLLASKNLRTTDVFRLLAADLEPCSVVVGNYTFGAAPNDVDLLARIAMICREAGSPFLAAADPSVLGAGPFAGMPDPRDWQMDDPVSAEFWQALRELPEAAYLGLALPRFLLRLPYGEETGPTESLPFEEMPEAPAHDHYLWGNPAIVCACLLGQTFARDGWQMRLGSIRQIAGLPVHVYERGGEPVAQPCAEALLTDRAAEAILARGIMPLVAERDGDRLMLVRFQSVALPPQPLAQAW